MLRKCKSVSRIPVPPGHSAHITISTPVRCSTLASSLWRNQLLSAPADGNQNGLQPRARRHATGQSPVWNPGVRTESRRSKVAPWRPPASTGPPAKSFVFRQNACKRLIFLKWLGTPVVSQRFSGLSGHCAFLLRGELLEYGTTQELLDVPKNPRTADHAVGRFG